MQAIRMLGARILEKVHRYLLGLLAQLLRGRTAAVENPGYDRPRIILENNGIPCRCVDIDGGGLDPAGLEESGADLCYVGASPPPASAGSAAWGGAPAHSSTKNPLRSRASRYPSATSIW